MAELPVPVEPKFLVFAETGEVRPLTDAEYQQGFDYLGNMPPTKPDFNFLLQNIDQRMKYLRYMIDHPSIPQMPDYLKEMVTTGSHIWVQHEADGKLHPMTLVDAKKAILDADGQGLFELEHRMRQVEMFMAWIALVNEAQAAHPDYASILIEDFKQAIADIDLFQCRATSVFKGDNSIDVDSLAGIRSGEVLMLTDGVAQENVTIDYLAQSGAIKRVVLTAPVKNTYDAEKAKLYRTTALIADGKAEGASEMRATLWSGVEWKGVNANTPITIMLDSSLSNAAAFTITTGIDFTADGAITVKPSTVTGIVQMSTAGCYWDNYEGVAV